jgi:hypothetical protein
MKNPSNGNGNRANAASNGQFEEREAPAFEDDLGASLEDQIIDGSKIDGPKLDLA